MKKITFFKILCLFILSGPLVNAQVGIGTLNPKGALDITSSQYGFVYPSVALTTSIVAAPVVNPKGGNLEVGTTVYNTSDTNTGANDVEPGIYSWDGTQWVTHFYKRQSEIFKQTSSLRTTSLSGFVDVPGFSTLPLFKQSFTAVFTGVYKLEVKTNFGGGAMVDNGDMNVAMIEGQFRFIFDTDTYLFNTKAFSCYNDHINGGTDYDNVWKESYFTKYVTLTAGQTYEFSLEFDQLDATGFVLDGNLLSGRGYVGEDLPCFVEITYIDE